MKIQITKEAKQWLTVAEMPEVRRIITYLKDDDVKDYARMAVRLLTGNNCSNVKIFEVSAKIAGNNRVEDYYTNNSGDLDVWISFIAYSENSDCFIKGGAYLSDIWSITGTESDNKLKSEMYVERYNHAE